MATRYRHEPEHSGGTCMPYRRLGTEYVATNRTLQEQGARAAGIASSIRPLHSLSLDWQILLQHVSDFLAQLQFLRRAYGKYMKNLQDPRNGWWVDVTSNTDESIEVLESRCDIYVRWISNYRDRTNIRINLVSFSPFVLFIGRNKHGRQD